MFENIVSWSGTSILCHRIEWELNLPHCQYGGEFKPRDDMTEMCSIKTDFAGFSDTAMCNVCHVYEISLYSFVGQYEDMFDYKYETTHYSYNLYSDQELVLKKLSGDDVVDEVDAAPIILPYELECYSDKYDDYNLAATICVRQYREGRDV